MDHHATVPTGDTIDGSVAFVTGAGGGIGSAIADALGAEGATVVRADLAGTDVVLDVTDADAVERTLADVVATHGRLDLAVTAAGMGVAGPTQAISLEDWRRTIDVNLWGTIHVVRSAYPRMVGQGRGRLVFVASLSGLVGTPLLVPYSTTKAAVVGLASSLRPEAAEHGVGVTVVCPGPVDTRMLDDGGVGGAAHGVDIRRYLTAAAGPAMPPAKVAAATVKGLRRGSAVVTPGRARIVHLGARLFPRGTERIITRAMRREVDAGS